MAKKKGPAVHVTAPVGAPTVTVPTVPTVAVPTVTNPVVAAAVDAQAAQGAQITAPKPPKPIRPTCTATRRDGQPCTLKVKEGLATCVDHQPAYDRLTEAQRVGFNQWVSGLDAVALANEIGWHRAKEIAEALNPPAVAA